MFVKVFFTLTGLTLVVVLSVGIYINSSQDFPPETSAIIDAVVASDVAELVSGETGVATSSGVEIWFESMAVVKKPKGTIVLSMGALAGALTWPDYFYKPLLDAGYRVIRYDHRGLGMSDWIPDWHIDRAYTLEDMALDVIAILDELNIEKAHIIGVSLGGMVGQRLAISHSKRILSLATIASSGYLDDPELATSPGSLNINMIKLYLKYGLFPTEKNLLKMGVAINYLFKGDGDYDVDVTRLVQNMLYELRRRQGFNQAVWEQHTHAISSSGSRYAELRKMKVPTLVIHGASDPVIPIEHAKKYADIIKSVKTLWLKGMGHDLPESYMSKIIPAILSNIERESSIVDPHP